MTQLLTVVTAPRSVDYLPETLSLLDGPAGPWWGTRILLADGHDRARRPGWIIASTARQLGSVRAFGALLALAGDPDLLVVVHDDAHLCRGALPRIQRIGVPEGLAAVMYYQEGWAGEVPGLHERLFGGRFVGAICAAYGRPALVRLRAFPWADWPVSCGLDDAISQALAGLMYAVHVPHLAQHVGLAPAIHRVLPAGERPSLSFDRDLDAASLGTPARFPAPPGPPPPRSRLVARFGPR